MNPIALPNFIGLPNSDFAPTHLGSPSQSLPQGVPFQMLMNLALSVQALELDEGPVKGPLLTGLETMQLSPMRMETAQPLQWSATPVVDAVHGARMPQLNEQIQQVAEYLAQRTEGVIRLGEGGLEANMKLYPPDLGGVHVAMKVGSDLTVQIHFIVEKPETAMLIEQHLQQFREALGRHGLNVERLHVRVIAQAGGTAAGEGSRSQGEAQQFLRRDPQFQQTRQQRQDPGRSTEDQSAHERRGRGQ